MSKLTPDQKNERLDFLLNRLKRGFSFLEVQRQFAKEFKCHMETARRWANWACDQMAEQEDQATRRRTYNVIIEMMHDQIVSFQSEILALQNEIKTANQFATRRTEILSQLETMPPIAPGRQSLVTELAAIPEITVTTISNMIEAKSRVRERMYRVIGDLARLRGFTGQTSDWRSALNTLLDNNLIPPQIADAILRAIDDFEGNIRAIDGEAPPANYDDLLDPDEFEQDDSPS